MPPNFCQYRHQNAQSVLVKEFVKSVIFGDGGMFLTHGVQCTDIVMSPLGDIYAFASWQNRHFGGVFRP